MNLIDMDRLRKELMAKGDIPIHEVFNTIWNQPIVNISQPSEDCVSRLIVQEEISKAIALKENPYQMYERIQAIPSVTPQQAKWIPVSERLPEQEGWYLTSLGDKTYGGADVDMYCKGWVKYGTHVLAWMPLPEPYGGDEG